MDVDPSELRRGLARTRPYLLSHHRPAEYDRCHTLAVRGRTVHLCARCSGIYPGIVAGLVAFALAPAPFESVVLVAVLPLGALVDWSASALCGRPGSNLSRTATGLALGYGYGLGLAHLLVAGRLSVLAVGAGYGLLAAGLLAVEP